jgi:hypothetical protein
LHFALLAALVLALATLLGLAGAAHPASALDREAKQLMGGSDWYHALEVIASVNETPPEVPLVLLLGGSAARECTVSDGDWTAQVLRRGGLEVVTRNIGSRNQSFYENVAFAKALPRVPTIVYIGVNLGRYTFAYTTSAVPLTPDPEIAARHNQHHLPRTILTLAEKRALVPRWLTRRYPIFRSRYTYNLGQLERVIRICKRRGLHPVMLDLPRNMIVIGHAFDRPIQRYQQGCRALAKKYHVPFLNFVRDARLLNRDFQDLAHIVESGRTKFQRLLSDKTIALLKRYDMVPPPIYEEPTPTPSASPTS